MQNIGGVAQTILVVLDPQAGGVYSASLESIRLILEKRGHRVEAASLRKVLDRLVRQGKVERVVIEDGSAVYTRPDVLLKAPGVLSLRTTQRPN